MKRVLLTYKAHKGAYKKVKYLISNSLMSNILMSKVSLISKY